MVEPFEAPDPENTLDLLLERVEQGERTLLSRNGQAVARLAPHHVEFDRAAAERAMHRILNRRRESGAGPFVWEEWKAYRDEGRR